MTSDQRSKRREAGAGDAPAPGAAAERSDTLDAIRALALIGVLITNMQVISGLAYMGPEALAQVQNAADRVLAALLDILVTGKALAAFSFLFGLSFAILLDSARRKAEPFLGFFLRRMAVLAGFGLLNAVAFFWGDILTTYAVLGLMLPLAMRLSQRAVLGLGLFLLVVPSLGLAAAGLAPPGLVAVSMTDSVYAFGGDSYWAMLGHNWAHFIGAVGEAAGLRLWRYATIGGLFLLGLYVGRSRLIFRVPANRGWLIPYAVAAIGLGGAVEAAVVLIPITGPAATALLWAKPLMATGYLAAAVLVLERPRAAGLRDALSPLGQMALTGYLMGGLLGQAVFYGWGLGQIGQTGTLGAILWTMLVVLVLVGFAQLWLARFRFGPWEWLWRALSRLERPPMRA